MLTYNHHGNYYIKSDKGILVDSVVIGRVFNITTRKCLTPAEHLIQRFWWHIPARKTINLYLVDSTTDEVIATKYARRKV